MTDSVDDNKLIQIAKHYQMVFGANKADAILDDLADFCGMLHTNFLVRNGAIDPLQMARMEGRREVYLYILQKLNVNLDDLRQTIKRKKEENDRQRKYQQQFSS